MFLKKKGKRLHLLYKYYQDSYFDNCPLPAEIIAKQISEDLEVEINVHQIYYINKYYLKGVRSDTKKNSLPEKSKFQLEPETEPEKEEWDWVEPKSYGDELRKQFAEHLKKPPKEEKEEIKWAEPKPYNSEMRKQFEKHYRDEEKNK